MLILLVIIKILLYILLFILGLVMLLLLIPVNYSGQVITAEGLKAEVVVGWAWKLFGINAEMEGEAVAVTLRIFNRRIYRIKNGKAAEEEEVIEELPENKEKAQKQKKDFSIKDIANRAFIEEIIEYFKRVVGILKPKYLHLYGTYGFEDPSITGILCGATGIINAMIPHARINLNPDFTREVIDLDIRAEGSMTAGSLVYQTIRTLFKRPVRKIWFRRKKS